MVRVTDLGQSLHFYRDLLGLQELRRMDNERGRFTLVFLGAPGNPEAQVELTHNWGVDQYDLGTGFGHIAVEVDHAAEACERVRRKGGSVIREAGPMKHGTTVIAFVSDPDGYKIEFIQKRG